MEDTFTICTWGFSLVSHIPLPNAGALLKSGGWLKTCLPSPFHLSLAVMILW